MINVSLACADVPLVRDGAQRAESVASPTFFLSVCLPARPPLSKSTSSAPADVQICVGSLQARQLTSPPNCPRRRHRPRRHQLVMDQSIVCFFFHKAFIPEELNPIDAKSNFAPEILNLMHAKLNLDMGSVSSLTHLADLLNTYSSDEAEAERSVPAVVSALCPLLHCNAYLIGLLIDGAAGKISADHWGG